MIVGREHPAALAIVLMSAIPPAAAVPLKNEVASDQYGPIMHIIPRNAIVSATSTSHGD